MTPAAASGPGERRARSAARSVLTGAVVVAASLVLGGLTSPAQQYLPSAIGSFANSIGGWTMLTFLLVWASRLHPLAGAVVGLLSFEALNEGYGIVSALRGYPYAPAFGTVWSLVGIVAGPIIGAAAAVTRVGRPDARVVGTSILSAVLVADGGWSLVRVADTTGPVYWILQLVAGAAFFVAAVVVARPSMRGIGIGLALIGAAVAAYPIVTSLVLG